MWWKVLDEMREFERGKADAALVKRDWCFWYKTRRPVFIEKSVSSAVRIPWITRSFPEARFIYMVRNGYAVAEGIRRRAGKGPYRLPVGLHRYPIDWCAQQWLASVQVIENCLEGVDAERVLRLRYEDFCASPSVTMVRIGEFLGLDDLISVSVTNVRDMDSEAIARLTGDDIEQINEVAAQELVRHGYALLGEATRGMA
jgi:hypothetical protein